MLIPAGAWFAVGEEVRASVHPARAFGGVYAGAALGGLAGQLLGSMVDRVFRWHPDRIGLIVGGAMSGMLLGYQALGGGPKR